MRPSSGCTNPAIESSTNVLPAPLGPNSTVTPAVAENSRSSVKPAESGRGAKDLRSRACNMAIQTRLGLSRFASVNKTNATTETTSTRVRATAPLPDSTAS